jgi:hypothetical protein
MDERIEVPSRDYLLKICREPLETVRNLGARPGNEYLLFLPAKEWATLRDRLDRVNRLAASTVRLLRACDEDSLTLNRVFNDEHMNIQQLIDKGARIAPSALSLLQSRLDELEDRTEPNTDIIATDRSIPS